MKVKINRNAAKVMNKMLNDPESEGKMIRVIITEQHGDHAHYALQFDNPTEHDEIVKTDKDIDILLDTRDADFLDGVWIQFFYVPEEGFVITNPSKGHHHH
ncbi:iron-sulfur cluster assembly accessory protein [Fredinandcohnia quinoae]|uniref:Iron-sulfur cluster assembly accessory protein n=1 Tax=Fredinandcohnia quinoae TaxID=2918902 RepID=A0AAW5E1N9_9BACI|nr:iron-sulfur cluster assembly accessory protein [Fredinandcohnia sp. SECRCQ15]MCH1624664.1 iron-sulfur cluster assembly accessory protein [Fredinandcohnia sp. SECRCQ15]